MSQRVSTFTPLILIRGPLYSLDKVHASLQIFSKSKGALDIKNMDVIIIYQSLVERMIP